ncbi:2,3-bisphosphoglycerate-independent phosphoglycerate mutase GpmI [Gottschalkia acidurici 9a]|uniref:2,3-bisphosphoglycerate-independent phosphoglycerate mutase n=1 Tax=Gottschalkia acidurici (strain ATCC 7906 / DSM 604 / BCRC 14475 / CIP 104303 / KCTC 5404 / NCIMB 10678 / 9a) TaxID=1128398 RepID=K0AZG8_GOTA9|nr:2,3-bisphosphoglycerate-independent phosphoglycerate mutase [Gottschalkia acidurici]AFS78105.1 2,3-bisphosphoglycerate-independent phosphoglycerate mutase GpmI [Gottschalkia acidurici 9a]
MTRKLVTLVILDGWGIGKDYEGNAILRAKADNYRMISEKYPNTRLEASGFAVGLPSGQMGNSEVGHLNIGAGRVVYQELTRITKSIQEKEFFEKVEFLQAIENCKNNKSKLHLMGLLSDGGVHSHNSHLYALLELAKQQGLKEVYVHCFLDGRDTPPQSAKIYLENLEKKIKDIGVGKIATISGRYYSMDRDKRWDRVEKAYNALILGEGQKASSSQECIEKSYAENTTDEFVIPTVIVDDNKPVATIDDNDSVIFFNFRPDRAREITRAIVDQSFDGFERKKEVKTHFVCMTMYDVSIENVEVAYKPESYENTLGEYVSSLGLKQLRIAETEKYAHVTFFFNGGVEEPNAQEDRVLIPSPKVATYDLKPEMSAFEVKDEVIKRIKSKEYDLIIINFANSDMVGHTGDLEAAIKAIEAVDICLGEVVKEVINVDGKLLITADHGNAEEMVDVDTGGNFTAHTTNKVPCIIVGEGDIKLREGNLADIAPTLLDMMGEQAPSEMTGSSLIIR